MNDYMLVIGDLWKELCFESDVYKILIEKIVSRLKEFFYYNPDDLVNRRLLTKIVTKAFSESDKTIMGETIIKRGGEANEIVEFLSHQDLQVTFLTAIGRNSEWMISELKDLGVDTRHINVVEQKTPIQIRIISGEIRKNHVPLNCQREFPYDGLKQELQDILSPKITFFAPLAKRYEKIIRTLDTNKTILAITVNKIETPSLNSLRKIKPKQCDLLFITLNDMKEITRKNSVEENKKVLEELALIVFVVDKNEGLTVLSREINDSIFVPFASKRDNFNAANESSVLISKFLSRFYSLVENKENLITLKEKGNIEEFRKLLKDCTEFAAS